ncbi:MAG: dienelactone hydrolase family protein [Rubrivivax sp.]|nr:dienelactone hydrolase family protein [Rubrivivax sp.]
MGVIVPPDSLGTRCDEVVLAADGRRADWLPSVQPLGAVVFLHGRGSGRGSPRNQHVARVFAGQRLACLLPDLLTDAESADPFPGGDLDLQCRRAVQALDWVARQPGMAGRPAGLFGASLGAAVALRVAAQEPLAVAAVVSRGGRPDLVEPDLPRVHAPTLLVVGGQDTEVLALNRRALRLLTCSKRLEVVPHATHLFAEPGTLDAVADLAAAWFRNHLADAGRRA